MTDAPLTIDAASLTYYQACRRRFLLDVEFRVLRWRPRHLFTAILREAVVRLSSGENIAMVIADARERYLQTAASPGLDIAPGANPYLIAKDYCAMLETVLRTLARLTLLTLRDLAPARLSSRLAWRFASHADESGALHRWVVTDRWTDDNLVREAHGWHVFGDMAMARVPLTLHVVEIGQVRSGRRASPWARGFKHPTMPSLRMRFAKRDGSSLEGWRAVYLADMPDADPDAWVDALWRDGIAASLVHHVEIAQPPDSVCDATTQQIMFEGLAMAQISRERASSTWSALPMSRGACHGFSHCPFVDVCYSHPQAAPESLGLYQIRTAVPVVPTQSKEAVCS